MISVLYRTPDLCVTAARVGGEGTLRAAEVEAAFGREYAASLTHRQQSRTEESFCAAALLLDTLALCGEKPSAVRRGEFGKPFFDGNGPAFSLSHDGGIAVCAISFGGEVGIDVCAVNRVSRMSASGRSAERFLGPEAALRLESAAPGERGRIFASAWADLEALSKMRGGRLAESFGEDGPDGVRLYRFALSSPFGECRASVCRREKN